MKMEVKVGKEVVIFEKGDYVKIGDNATFIIGFDNGKVLLNNFGSAKPYSLRFQRSNPVNNFSNILLEILENEVKLNRSREIAKEYKATMRSFNKRKQSLSKILCLEALTVQLKSEFPDLF